MLIRVDTVRVFSRRKDRRCDTTPRAFVARPVDPTRAPDTSGVPVPGSLLLGVTGQKASVPYPVVARISADGTRIERGLAVFAAPERYRFRGDPRERHDLVDIEVDFRGPIAAGRARSRDCGTRKTKLVRRTYCNVLDVAIGAGGLDGTYSSRGSFRSREYRESYDSGPVDIRAATAA